MPSPLEHVAQPRRCVVVAERSHEGDGGAGLRAAATAWLRPLPPACSAYDVAEHGLTGPRDAVAVVATRSRLALPTTQTSNIDVRSMP